MKDLTGCTIQIDGDTYKVLSVGVIEDGRASLHLQSTCHIIGTRHMRKRGVTEPVYAQSIHPWVDLDSVEIIHDMRLFESVT